MILSYTTNLMTRNLKKELGYFTYSDMENGNDEERIDYDCLIELLTEIIDRLETIENDLYDLNAELKAGPEWGDL